IDRNLSASRHKVPHIPRHDRVRIACNSCLDKDAIVVVGKYNVQGARDYGLTDLGQYIEQLAPLALVEPKLRARCYFIVLCQDSRVREQRQCTLKDQL